MYVSYSQEDLVWNSLGTGSGFPSSSKDYIDHMKKQEIFKNILYS